MAYYPRLVSIKKNGTRGSVYPFPKGRCSVGGASGCDIYIRGAGSSHCLFIVDKNNQAHVVNVSGTTDVHQNGKNVDSDSFLSHQDIVEISSRQFCFEWVQKQKGRNRPHQPEVSGEARESLTLQNGNNEGHPVQQSNGTSGASTPTAYSFDQSFFKTPRIPPELFVSPLSASGSDNGGEGGSRITVPKSSQLDGSSSSTPLIDEPRIRTFRSSTSSTPLCDEPRVRAARSSSPLESMVNSPLEQEQPALQESQSWSPLKSGSQSCQMTTQERSSKRRTSDSYGSAQSTSLAGQRNANGQSGPSSRSSSVEYFAAHIEVLEHPGTTAQFFTASTPVARTAGNGSLQSNKAKKINISFSDQGGNSDFAIPGTESCCPNISAITDESFLDSHSLSRRTLRSSQASLTHSPLSASGDSLGCEALSQTHCHTDSLKKKANDSFISQGVQNDSLGNKHAHKRHLHVASEGWQQSNTKSIKARNSMEKNTTGAHPPSDQCTRGTRAKSSLGQSSECTTSVRTAETTDSLEGSNFEDYSGGNIMGCLDQEGGVPINKTSKRTILTNSTLGFKQSAGDKLDPVEISAGAGAARSSITDSAVALPTWNEPFSNSLPQDFLNVTADDSKRATRSTSFSLAPGNSEQEDALASEKGNAECVPGVSQSEQELLEHTGILAESPMVTVSKRSSRASASRKVSIEVPVRENVGVQSPETPKIERMMQCSSQMLENNPESAPEEATLPTRSRKLSHTPTSRKIRKEASKHEISTPSPSVASRPRQMLTSRNADEETDQKAVISSSPGSMMFNCEDIAIKGSIRKTRSGHEFIATKADKRASEAEQTSISKKESEGIPKTGTPRSLKALAASQVLRSSDENEAESTSLPKRMSLQNMGASLEGSFGHTRSTRSSCTPSSVSACVERTEKQIGDTPVAVKGSKGKQAPVSRLAVRGGSKAKTNSEVLGAEKTPTSHELNEESSPDRETVITSLCKHVSSEDVVVSPEKCLRGIRSTRHSVTPSKCTEDGIPRQVRADTPTSKRSEEEKAPGQLESKHMAVASVDLAMEESPGRIAISGHVSMSKERSMDPLELETMSPPNPSNLGRVRKVWFLQDAMEQASRPQIADTPKSLKIPVTERAASKKAMDEEDGQWHKAGTSPAKHVSPVNTCIVIEKSVRATRSSCSPTCGSMDMGTPGSTEVGPGECTPAECTPLMNLASVMNESVRSSHTPVPGKSSKEALEHNFEGMPDSLEASRDKQSVLGKVRTSTALQEMLGALNSLIDSGAKRPSTPIKTTEGSPNPFGAGGTMQIVPGKVHNETLQQQMADTQKSLKASASKQASTSKKTIEEQEDLKQTTWASPTKHVSLDNTCTGIEQLVGATRSRCSSVSRNASIENPSGEALVQKIMDTPKPLKSSGGKKTTPSNSADEKTIVQDIMCMSRVPCVVLVDIGPLLAESVRTRNRRAILSSDSEKSNEGPLEDEMVGLTPSPLKVTGLKKATSKKVRKTSQHQTADTPKPLEASTAEWASTLKNVIEEEKGHWQKAGASSSKEVSSNDTCVVIEKSVRATRSSRTPASRNVATETPGLGEVHLQETMEVSGAKRTALSRKNKKASAQKPMKTPKSSKASGVKQVQASNRVNADEHVTFHDTDSDVEASDRTKSTKASHMSSNEVKLNVQKKEMEVTVDSDKKASKSSKSKRAPASKRATTAEETAELEVVGMSPSKRLSFDKTEVTAEAFGRATRATRSRCMGTFKNTNVKTAGQEAEGTLSPLKALGTVQALASNRELGESPKLEAAVASKTLSKTLRARATRSVRKLNDEVPEKEATGALPSECYQNAIKPTRNTRGCHRQASRSDNVEAPKEKTGEHVRSAATTRAKRTRGSRKACKDVEIPQDVAGGSLAVTTTSQQVDVTSNRELQGELSPIQEVTIAGKTRGKRKLNLKQKTTVDNVIDIDPEKNGRHKQHVASAEDVPQQNNAQHSDNIEQAIYPKNTRGSCAAASSKKAQSRKAVDDTAASDFDRTTVEPASADGKASAAIPEQKRSKRKVAAVKVDTIQTATEGTPKKTRGRRTKAPETVLAYTNDKAGASRRAAEEVPPPKRTRKKV